MEAAEFIDNFIELDAANIDAMEPGDLFDLVVKIEQMSACFRAKTMTAQAAAEVRKVHRERRHRSAPIGMAAQTRLNQYSCSSHLKQADLMVRKLPRLFSSFNGGVLNEDQMDLICSYARQTKYAKQAVEAQPYFLSIAHCQWDEFRQKMHNWATIADETDPQDEDDKAHLDRRFCWGQGLGRTVLAELSIPNDLFEQMLVILRPVYDRMFQIEWREAKLAKGENPDTSDPDDADSMVTHKDLARTDRQRWLDALMIVVRAGGMVSKQVRIREGDPNIDDQFELGDLDPGVLAEVVIVCDKETIERELARRNGETLEPRTTESLDNFRCETLSGLPVTPATALKTLEIGYFRRMVMKPGDLDFSMSRLSRFFIGAKRLGLQIRDRRCVTDGCGAAAERCQADHIAEYTKNGKTIPINGQMLCGPCHRHKTWLQARGFWDDQNNRPKAVDIESVDSKPVNSKPVNSKPPPKQRPRSGPDESDDPETDHPASDQLRQLFDPNSPANPDEAAASPTIYQHRPSEPRTRTM